MFHLQRLTHEISITEDDPAPVLRKGRKRKSDDSEESKPDIAAPSSSSSASTAATPAKKIKTEATDEVKIAVDYNKAKKKTTSSDDASTSDATDDSAKNEPPKTILYNGKKEKCKYWDKCYQTGGDHKKQFLHPGDDMPAGIFSTKLSAVVVVLGVVIFCHSLFLIISPHKFYPSISYMSNCKPAG